MTMIPVVSPNPSPAPVSEPFEPCRYTNCSSPQPQEAKLPSAFTILTRPPGRLHNSTRAIQKLLLRIRARAAASLGNRTSTHPRVVRASRRLSGELTLPKKSSLAERLLSLVEVGTLSFGFLYLVVCFCCMFNPPSRRGQHAHTSDAGPPFLGTATLKCPPTWCVERAHVYTLRSWISDLILWSTATEIPANRQAAIAALQVTGSARELVRELPPEVLRDGHVDPQTGQQLTGLMVLVQHLARRYAPMEQETSTKAISELLNFCRMQGETIDELLVRFDILRNRAIVRGGLGINVQGLSWMLLRAMQIGPEEWDKFLHFNGGQLPHDQATMNQLVERLRRFGHLQEGAMKHGTRQGGTGDPGNYFFPVFTEHPGPSACAGGGMPSAASPMPHAQAPHFGANAWSSGSSQAFVSQAGAGSPEASYIAHEDGHMQCPHCHSYFDEEFSSGTDSDSDSELDGMYQSVQVDGETRTDETAVMNQVYQEYVMAKRKWRRMSGRPPRRYRKFNYKQRRHVPHLQRSSFRNTFASFLPPNAFAAGKGHSKGSNKGGHNWRKNPRGRDGKPLRCLRCGSDEHLFKRCPQVVSNQARGDSKAFHASSFPAITNPPTFGTFTVDPSWQSSSAFHSVPTAESVKHYHLSSVPASSAPPATQSVADTSSGIAWQDLKGFELELSRLRSVSQPASEVGSAGQESHLSSNRCVGNAHSGFPTSAAVNADTPPSWEPGMSSVALHSVTPNRSDAMSVERLVRNAPEPAYPPPSQAAPSLSSDAALRKRKDEEERKQVTRDLSSLLYPWWEVSSPKASKSSESVYHLRTRLKGDRVGLLVDPGAHDNLAGEDTMQRLGQQVGCSPEVSGLSKKLMVEGVGKDAQQATQAWEIPIFMQSEDGEPVKGKYRAPVIPGSTLPPLLGLKALRAMGAVIDCAQGKMLLPGPGGYSFQLSPGSRMFRLSPSDSGHLILPVDNLSSDEPEQQ